MANFDEQVLRAWDEFEQATGADAINPDDFLAWALENNKLAPRPQDLRKLLRKQVTSALRTAIRRDDGGFSYRAKQCVKIIENGVQIPLWFDTDSGGTSNLRQKAIRQRRDGIANDVYRAVCDVEHMNKVFPEDQLSFHLDFVDDVAERRIAEATSSEKDDDEAA
ncbi:hypothetical protein [Pseudolabrys sp. FHR47]|uniref:hypothetical protein n=1 Tax=Pseudolabrys sp. FHR47 TaxID=2562284 RepID=UPI0010BF5650|nr:hypothetical protein [Pseudolabrys sp. FHR47]